MAQYLYQINTKNGIYIGKLAQPHFLQDHLSRAGLPWESKQVYSWEVAWKQDILNNGFKNQTFVQYGYRWNATEVIQKLKDYFNKYVGSFQINDSTETAWDVLKEVWYKEDADDYVIAEALCILLASKEYSLLNTQVDFLSKPADMVLNESYARQLLSVEEMEARRIRSINSEPNFYITVTVENGILDDITDQVHDLLIPVIGKNKITINLTQKKKLATALSYRITDIGKKKLIQKLKEYKNSISGAGSRTARANIQATIDYINNPENEISGDIYQHIFNSIAKAHSALSKTSIQVDLKRKQNFMASALMDWYNNCTVDMFLVPNTQITLEEDAGPYYRKQFTNFLQQNGFKPNENILRAWATTEDLREFKTIKHGEFDNTKPYYQVQNTLAPYMSIFPFLQNNWHNIYYEQFDIWVKNFGTYVHEPYVEKTDKQIKDIDITTY